MKNVGQDDDIVSLQSISFLVDASKRDNTLSIPIEARKLLIQVYGREIKKFTDGRKLHGAQLQKSKPPVSSPNQPLVPSKSSTPMPMKEEKT